jgi:hypothetical protein
MVNYKLGIPGNHTPVSLAGSRGRLVN